MATVETKVNLAGRPALYTDVEDFKAKIEEYFTLNETKSTITGLAFHLGFESRQSFYDYLDKGEFSYIGKRARLFVEACYESKLSGNNAAGPIFFLKNMGWSDRNELDVTSKGEQINGFNYIPPKESE